MKVGIPLTLYGFYTDESGNNGFGDMHNQPVLCYAGILVPLEQQIHLNHEVQKILDNLKQDIKLKIHGIPEEHFDEIDFFKYFEIHGKAFIDGENFYYNLSDEERFRIIGDCLKLLQNQNIIITASITNKKTYLANTNDQNHNKMHIQGYTELIHILNSQLAHHKEYAFIICDDGKPSEIRNFYQALKNPHNKRVYPDLQIKVSHDKNCTLIQLADLVNFITSVYFRSYYHYPPRKRHQAEILQLYKQFIQHKIKIYEYT